MDVWSCYGFKCFQCFKKHIFRMIIIKIFQYRVNFKWNLMHFSNSLWNLFKTIRKICTFMVHGSIAFIENVKRFKPMNRYHFCVLILLCSKQLKLEPRSTFWRWQWIFLKSLREWQIWITNPQHTIKFGNHHPKHFTNCFYK